MKTKFKIGGFFALASLILLNACKKEDLKPEGEDNTAYDNSSAPKSNALIESAYDEMSNISDQAINGDLQFYNSNKVTVFYVGKEEFVYDKTECNVQITIDTLSSTRSVTVDWGSTNCDCYDGKQRRGKIITTFTGKYRDVGTIITHTPDNYYVNDNKIQGSRTVTNMGLNTESKPYYNVSVNGLVTMSTGEVFTYTSSRTRTWTAGFSTVLNFLDDEYEIRGTSSASSSNGNGYEAEITEALLIKVGCGFITKGILEFTPTGKLKRTINYGEGTCDATFTVTIGGKTYTIN
jgi:hypothetical protein